MDADQWDWDRALEQFDANCAELAARRQRSVGFGANSLARAAGRNGSGEEIPF